MRYFCSWDVSVIVSELGGKECSGRIFVECVPCGGKCEPDSNRVAFLGGNSTHRSFITGSGTTENSTKFVVRKNDSLPVQCPFAKLEKKRKTDLGRSIM